MKTIYFLLILIFCFSVNLSAQITNGQINYEMRIDQWYQGCENDNAVFSADDNEVRVGLVSDGNTGGTTSWPSLGIGATCSGNNFVRRWQADASSTVTNSNTLIYFCTGRTNAANLFTINHSSWEEDDSPDCSPSGDACQSSGTWAVTFKSAVKTPNRWWAYNGTADVASFVTGMSGDFSAKTVWRYTYGYDCSNPLAFGTLVSGTTYSHTNSNRGVPTGATAGAGFSSMGYTNVSDNASPDVFYQFTILNPSTVAISTANAGTNYDTYLRLKTAGCGTQLAFNDDYGGSVQSYISMDLCPGTYVIQVEGFSGNTGDFNLSVQATNKLANGGTIAGIANGLVICSADDPGAFTNSVSATGIATLAYQWESSTTSAGAGYTNISGAITDTYDPGTLASTTWFRRKVTDGCGNVAYSNVIQVVVTSPVGNPAVFGTNVWNVYGYNGNSTTLTANTYRGFYVQPVLSATNYGVATQNFWGNGNSPSNAGTTINSGNLWNGCSVNPDTHTFTHKRKGFPCGVYTVTFQNWDDETRMLVNGANVWSCGVWSGDPGGFSNSTGSTYFCGTNVFTIYLDANSEVEIQVFEGGGGSNLGVDIVNSSVALAGGTIGGIANGAVVCVGSDPGVFSDVASPSGGSIGEADGSPTAPVYQWESSTTSASSGYSNLATGLTYDPGVLSATTWFRRKTTDACGNVAYSNVIQVVVNTLSTAPTSVSGTSIICSGNSTTLTSNGGTLGTDAVDVWYVGACVNEAYSQEWATQPFGTPNTIVNSLTNGILNVSSTSNDPMIDMGALGSFNPTVHRYVNIRYRVTAGTAGIAQIFFYNAAHNFAVGGESGTTTLISNGQWNIATVDMWNDPQYQTGGNILGWRFDWAGASGVTMDIDFITLSDRPIFASGSSITVSPTTTTSYFTAKKGECNTTSCASVTVTVNPALPASVSIAATPGTNVCIGTNVTFTATPTNGGTPTYQWKLNGSNVGTNSPTYSNNALTSTSVVTCEMTSTATCATGSPATSNSISGIVPAAPTAISGTASAVCQVPAGSGWVRFLDGTGRLVVSINPGSNNLGLVTADAYDHGSSVSTQACNTGTNPEWTTAVLGRSWRITPTNNLGASLELPFEDGEMSNLVTASSNTASNPRDNVSSRGDLKMSRYSGASQNGSWSDNCTDGGTSLIGGQLGNGTSPAGIATSQYVQFATPGFSEFWLHGNTTASPLPITLTNFGASCDEKSDVQLNWSTASEQNASHFVIERSRDLVTWNVVSTLPAGGNTTTEQLYALTDVDALGGVSYYRLVQVDFDGESEIYGPIAVTCESATGNTMTVFPNPTKANFTVEITSTSSATNATLQLTDLTGKVIASRQVDLVAGNNQLLFSDLDLQMGTYIVRMQSELEIRPVKLVVTD